VNVRAVRDLASRGAKLVHLSTNYVFDGRRDEPYGEDDLPNPRSTCALTKLAGEHAALAYGEDALVVRGAGLYGKNGSASKGGNFVERMVARAKDRRALRMVADQRLQPTYTADLARSLIDAVDAGASGLLHLTASGACSWVRVHRGDHGAQRDRRRDRASADHDRPRAAGPAAQRRARETARRRNRAR
jgi:dTDP-4-dehydrorhamnose reductase